MTRLAGVDPPDDWTDPSTGKVHGIDGVDIWQSLLSSGTKVRKTPSWPSSWANFSLL